MAFSYTGPKSRRGKWWDAPLRGHGEILCALRPDRLLTRAAQSTIRSRDRQGAIVANLKHLPH